MDRKTQTKIREIIVKGGLHEYEIEVASLITTILSKGCKVRSVESTESSRHQFNPDGCIIQVGIANRKTPLHILWDFLHEYGHFLSPPPKPEDLRLKREELAWEFAEKEMKKYARLQQQILEFEKYREECLFLYRKYPTLRISDAI